MSAHTCARCGRTYDEFEAGVYLPGFGWPAKDVDLCHPEDPTLPDCYRLVTVHGEPAGDYGPIKVGGMISRLVAGKVRRTPSDTPNPRSP